MEEGTICVFATSRAIFLPLTGKVRLVLKMLAERGAMKNLGLQLFVLVGFFSAQLTAQVIDVANQPGEDLRAKIKNAIASKECTATGCILDARTASPDSGLVLDSVFADTRGKSLTLRLSISTYAV